MVVLRFGLVLASLETCDVRRDAGGGHLGTRGFSAVVLALDESLGFGLNRGKWTLGVPRTKSRLSLEMERARARAHTTITHQCKEIRVAVLQAGAVGLMRWMRHGFSIVRRIRR